MSSNTWGDQDLTNDDRDIHLGSAINVTAGFADLELRVMMHTLHAMNQAMGLASLAWAIHSRVGEGEKFRVILELISRAPAPAEDEKTALAKQGVFTYCVVVPETESVSQIA